MRTFLLFFYLEEISITTTKSLFNRSTCSKLLLKNNTKGTVLAVFACCNHSSSNLRCSLMSEYQAFIQSINCIFSCQCNFLIFLNKRRTIRVSFIASTHNKCSHNVCIRARTLNSTRKILVSFYPLRITFKTDNV